ncbi:MAG: DUF4397 domain-containing protein [Acidimicrobiales bacterium]
MNDQSETERSAADHWFGLDRLRLSDGDQAVDITIGSESHWDRSHLRRLRQSGDLPGMVPIIDSDFSADGKPFAVTPVVDAPTLSTLVSAGSLDWTSGAGITEAAARAAHEAHLRGLFHGALSPSDIHVLDNDVAIGGIGLGLGGTPPGERAHWVAPEVRDGAEPSERSDVFSLGKILESALGDAIDTVPRSIRRLIMWSSSDTPEARPPSAMEFASILAEGLGEDRKTYGPAFIPTAGTSDLATRASSAVSNHTPSATARETASAAGAVGLGGALAGAQLLGGNDDIDLAGEGDVDPVAGGPDAGDLDPAVVLDDMGPTPPAVEAGPEEEGIAGFAATTPEPDTETVETFESPAVARTVDLDETFVPSRRRNRAGLVVGAILAVGLGLIVWNLLGSSDDEDLATAGTTTDAPATTAAPTTTEAPVTTAAPTTTEAPVTTAAPTTTQAPVTAAAPADGPVAAGDAAIQLLHGVPGATVDAYLDGNAVATGFTAGTVAGPMTMAPGNYELALFAATDDPPANAADRTDQPLLTDTVALNDDAASVIAHLDERGQLAVSSFAERLSPLDPGQGRIVVRHVMAAGAVEASVGGEILGSLSPGDETAIEVAAGSVPVEIRGADGETLVNATVAVDDGELASLSVIGSPGDDSAEIVIQRFTGLATAPAAVPTGDSGLLGTGDDQSGVWVVYLMMAVLALAGGVVAIRRQRSLR